MPYTVSHGGTIDGQRPGPVALDVGLNLKQALQQACYFLAEGQPNVSIVDGKGNQISGADLVACCNNEKTLTPDLRLT
jgi:hypothetical protein